MPFCPKCRYEYQPDVTKCPDCDAWLVSSLPPEPEEEFDVPNDEREWIPLAKFPSHATATLVEEALESKGISAVVYDDICVLVARDSAYDADNEGLALMGDEWKKYSLIEPETPQVEEL
ncbi:MAG TPA: hypothetical protein VMS71_00365 [Candidatus Acidoferrum sp.]|nr:hypothetical protein [Candidatus Acidoferrum sp.]